MVNGHDIGQPAKPVPAPQSVVTLEPRKTAHAILRNLGTAAFSDDLCRSTTGDALQVQEPNAKGPANVVAMTLQTCSGKAVNLEVGPISLGTGIPGLG